MLVHVVSSEFSRKPEIPADRLPDLHSVQRSCQRIDDAVRDRPVVLVPQVVGCDEVEASAENRSEEQLDPFGGDRAEIRVHDRAGLDAKTPGHFKDRPEGAALSRHALIGGNDPVQEALSISDEHDPEVHTGLGHHVRSAIGGAAIRVHQDRAVLWKVFG